MLNWLDDLRVGFCDIRAIGDDIRDIFRDIYILRLKSFTYYKKIKSLITLYYVFRCSEPGSLDLKKEYGFKESFNKSRF